jgi:hypothetical protein
MSFPVAIGVARLARFRADGLAAFDASPAGLLNALAPWLAFALVGFVLMLVAGSPVEALGGLLGTVVALLAPAVLSELLTRLWGREAAWLRYAVAFIWCQWIMPPALLVAMLGSGMLVAAGMPGQIAELLGAIALLVYALALHFFIARQALDLSRWRTAVIVATVNLGTGVLVMVPGAVLWLARGTMEGAG